MLLRKHPDAMKNLFVDCHEKLTFEKFRSLYDIKYSEIGSNNRPAEEDTVFCFEAFLMDSEGRQDIAQWDFVILCNEANMTFPSSQSR